MGRKPDKTPPHKIKLVDLPKALSAKGVNVTYIQCYNAVLNSVIPAERSASGGRWLVDERKFPSIIRKFSLLKE